MFKEDTSVSNHKIVSDGGLVPIKGFPLEYDPLSGEFYWTEQRGSRSKGSQAGNVNNLLGYVQIRYKGVLYYAHRLAYLAMHGHWPKFVVDHIDKDGLNNSWENLRPTTVRQNHLNTTAPSHNTSGHKGICYFTRDKKWVFRVNNRVRSYHDTLEEAVKFKEEWSKDEEYYCEG